MFLLILVFIAGVFVGGQYAPKIVRENGSLTLKWKQEPTKP